MYHELVSQTHVTTFDGVADLVEQVQHLPYGNFNRWIGPLDRSDFLGRGFSSWEAIYAAALEPWDEGQRVVDRMITQLESVDLPKPKSRKRKMRFDEADGDELDLDKLRDGQPFWRKSQRAMLSGPQTVVIVIDLNARAGINHRDILWRGAAAIAMTHILEDAGFRVELWAVYSSYNMYDGSNHSVASAILLKRASDPLDTGTTVSAVSGWFVRSLIFRSFWINGAIRDTARLGMPRVPYDSEVRSFARTDDYILVSGVYSEGGAIYIAREALQKLAGVQPPPEPEPLEDLEPVTVAKPTEPPKPLTKAEMARQAAEQRRSDREYRKWAKEWAAKQRNA